MSGTTAKELYAIADQLQSRQQWAPNPDRTVAAIRRIVGDPQPSGEFGTVVSSSGGWAYVKRAGQTTSCKIRVLGGLALVADDKVLIERPHGTLKGAFTRTKVT